MKFIDLLNGFLEKRTNSWKERDELDPNILYENDNEMGKYKKEAASLYDIFIKEEPRKRNIVENYTFCSRYS